MEHTQEKKQEMTLEQLTNTERLLRIENEALTAVLERITGDRCSPEELHYLTASLIDLVDRLRQAI